MLGIGIPPLGNCLSCHAAALAVGLLSMLARGRSKCSGRPKGAGGHCHGVRR